MHHQGNASLYDSDSEEDSEAERLRKQRRTDVLGKASRRRFEAMLRGITLRRERIAGAMLFALEHAHAADTVRLWGF
jgi:U2-associated protein SR140